MDSPHQESLAIIRFLVLQDFPTPTLRQGGYALCSPWCLVDWQEPHPTWYQHLLWVSRGCCTSSPR